MLLRALVDKELELFGTSCWEQVKKWLFKLLERHDSSCFAKVLLFSHHVPHVLHIIYCTLWCQNTSQLLKFGSVLFGLEHNDYTVVPKFTYVTLEFTK